VTTEGREATVGELRESCWNSKRAYEYMERLGAVKGCNYLPANHYRHRQLFIDFDEDVCQRELSWARAIGFNSVRIFVLCFVYQLDRDLLFHRFERFIDICEENSISVTVVLQPSMMDPDHSQPPHTEKNEIPFQFHPGIHPQDWRYPGVIEWPTSFGGEKVGPEIARK
jgi:hypothetical protein